jgi:hypothetical protein
VASRWRSIARAHHDGRPLLPIDVIECKDGYYVLDGRHRVSVARALGHDEIEAWTRPAFAGSQARVPDAQMFSGPDARRDESRLRRR